MDLAGIARSLRLHWRLIAICAGVATIIGWFTAPAPGTVTADSPRYQATATLVAADGVTPEEANLGLAAYLVTASDVPRIAAETLGTDDDPVVLRQMVSASVNPDVGTLAISATDLDRGRAVAVAEAFAAATTSFLVQDAQADRAALVEQTQLELETITARMTELDQQIDEAEGSTALLEAQLAAETTRYQTVYAELHSLNDPAQAPTSGLQTIGTTDVVVVSESSFLTPPSGPVPRALLFGIIGLALGLLAALALGRLDTRLRNRSDIENAFSAPVLAEIPKMTLSNRRRHELVVKTHPYTADAEAYRTLRSALRLAAQQVSAGPPDGLHVVLVTSVRSGEGKSTTIANLATALAETGQTVLVVDSDFRNPRQHEYLDAMSGVGLRELLTTPGEMNVAKAVRATAAPGVRVLTNGSAEVHPTALLMRLEEILEQARELADIILIDCAPLPSASETLDIAQLVDASLVICRAGRTNAEDAVQLRTLLDRSGTPLLGVVLVGVPRPAPTVLTRGVSSSVPRRRSPEASHQRPSGTGGRRARGRGQGQLEVVRREADGTTGPVIDREE